MYNIEKLQETQEFQAFVNQILQIITGGKKLSENLFLQVKQQVTQQAVKHFCRQAIVRKKPHLN